MGPIPKWYLSDPSGVFARWKAAHGPEATGASEVLQSWPDIPYAIRTDINYQKADGLTTR